VGITGSPGARELVDWSSLDLRRSDRNLGADRALETAA